MLCNEIVYKWFCIQLDLLWRVLFKLILGNKAKKTKGEKAVADA